MLNTSWCSRRDIDDGFPASHARKWQADRRAPSSRHHNTVPANIAVPDATPGLTGSVHDKTFSPLADVADLVWPTKRFSWKTGPRRGSSTGPIAWRGSGWGRGRKDVALRVMSRSLPSPTATKRCPTYTMTRVSQPSWQIENLKLVGDKLVNHPPSHGGPPRGSDLVGLAHFLCPIVDEPRMSATLQRSSLASATDPSSNRR